MPYLGQGFLQGGNDLRDQVEGNRGGGDGKGVAAHGGISRRTGQCGERTSGRLVVLKRSGVKHAKKATYYLSKAKYRCGKRVLRKEQRIGQVHVLKKAGVLATCE